MHTKVVSDIAPFRMAGNLYFVGARAVSVHLIDTGDGLILIDTGYPHMRSQILDSIRALGFDPADIRILLHSHGHYDHIGSTIEFKALSGAKTCISRIDNAIVNGTLNLSWADELGHDALPFFDGDVLLEDGDTIRLGNTCIRCMLTPGHTAGTLSFFFEVQDGESTYTAAMHGGVGTNSMEKAFLDKYGLSTDCREIFRRDLHRLAKMHVDIVLGNHPDQSDTEGKLQRILSGEKNACIDPDEWPAFLKHCETRLDNMLAQEQYMK